MEFHCHIEELKNFIPNSPLCDTGICKKIVPFTRQLYQLDIKAAVAVIKTFSTKHSYSATEEATSEK